jgi:hypothetical protein
LAGVAYEEWLSLEKRENLFNPAALIEQRRALVRQDYARGRAGREMPFDLIREMMHIDDRGRDARLGEIVERIVDQRLARDGYERLWNFVSQRPHSRAEAGGENHGCCGKTSVVKRLNRRSRGGWFHTMP